MSSTLRKFSQIPVRIKYFLTLAEYDPAPPAEGVSYDDPALVFPGGYPGPIVGDGALGIVDYPGFAAGVLLKDLGRQVVIVDSMDRHIAVYREVQRVNGSGSEGVGPQVSPDGPYGTFFVKVWAADGSNVLVARTG